MPEVVTIFKALADPTRLAVFNCIRGCAEDEGASISVIRREVPCAPSTITHHLNELRDAGLIETVRRGRIVYCNVKPEALGTIAEFISNKMTRS